MTNELSKIEVKNSVIASSNVSSNVVDEIKKLDIITPIDIQRLENAGSFILANFRDIPSYRPLIVKITSVLNDSNFPTPDMKYWQCGKEAEVHFNELTRDYFKYQRSIVDIEEMTHKINEMDKMLTGSVSLPPESKYDPALIQFDKKRLEIQRSQYEFELKLLEKDIKHRIQEVIEWNDISKKLAGDCKFSLVNYAEHYDAEGHIAWLQERLKDPKTDDKGKANYKSQLDTFIRLSRKPSK